MPPKPKLLASAPRTVFRAATLAVTLSPVATTAVSLPWGVAVLPDGDPVFSNQNRHRIRSLDSGLVLTLAGT